MEALHNNPSDVLFGTMDSWVLWNLTGGNHLTDVSNASRTFLMNLRTLQWEHELLKFFDIPQASLPKILPSGGHFGFIKDGPFAGISINSVLGDQMAAAIGHGIFKYLIYMIHAEKVKARTPMAQDYSCLQTLVKNYALSKKGC
jgi:glycerol kinase